MACMRDHFHDGAVLGGRYKTLAPLNHGSFGMVFMARDMQTSDTVAIKCLTKRSAADEAGLDFAIDDKSEELVLHKVLGDHPNIVNLLDSFETDAHVYLVLEFCPRGDLYEAIRNGHGPLETEHVRRFMLELIDAVSYVHSKGIYHRDIKPENIFLTQSGAMKLGDFGLATTEKWTYESTVGSDRYMSPEQYESAGAGYSPAHADIWAIGIVLLNVLFSRNPFTTPTEQDPLFLDFSRDKQSLFDVFPSMSMDTYEVIVQCMNMDPSKRSLIGARNALRRVVSFTTSDECFDEFCYADRRGVPSSAREPLRTPSIQSPQVDNGAFPWAKALQTSNAQPIRQLKTIPDESYSEELFSKSDATTDWCSATTGATPSTASVFNSSLANSMASLNINNGRFQRPTTKVSPMAGSLPITMSRPKMQPSLSTVFGRKDTVSKSWSDMWEEDVEEEEQRTKQLDTLKKLNSRTWSQDSNVNDENTPRQSLSPATKSAAIAIATEIPSIEDAILSNIDDDLAADGIFFAMDERHKIHDTPRYSPPSKRSGVDKWAQLGERRRAYTGRSSATQGSEPFGKHASQFGNSNGNGFTSLGHSVWDMYNNVQHQTNNRTMHSNHYNNNYSLNSPNTHQTPTKWNSGRDRVKESPWNKSKSRGREWNWRREKRSVLGDFEWVGGWQEARS